VPRSGVAQAARTGLVSAAVSAVVTRLADGPALDGIPGWRRTNYRGRTVSLAGGTGAVAGALAGALLEPSGRRGAAVLAGTAAAAAGAYDDLLATRAEVAGDKGFAGHLAAIRAGRVSGGVVKVAVIGGAALVAAGRLDGSTRSGTIGGLADRLLRAGVIAGSANLLNLLDLRPGRAGKVAVAAGGLLASGPGGGVAAAGAGAAAGVLPSDLGERTMLGDLGANTLGALLGVRLAAGSVRTRTVALVVIGAITAASERVSLSKVIDDTPALRRLDRLGRAPIP
jgi:UDP-N-acetylmuramyl pentapeptide phosphotransferase/UDP-N-acetylglucosamine-1-phosphate transferase